jgi:hydrogenase maturation protease
MEFLVGYQRVIIIDAITTRLQPEGTVSHFRLEEMPDLTAGHTTSTHDTSLQTALAMGQSMELELPDEVWVVGIEAWQVYDFSEKLTPPLEDAVPRATRRVLELLRNLEGPTL